MSSSSSPFLIFSLSLIVCIIGIPSRVDAQIEYVSVEATSISRSDTIIDTVECKEMVSPSGNYVWTESGVYFDTLINSQGMDSIIEFNLTIPVISWQMWLAPSLTSVNAFSNATGFQWLNCNKNFKKINGKTDDVIYTSIQGGGGSFSCELTLLGCKDTTECVDLVGVGNFGR